MYHYHKLNIQETQNLVRFLLTDQNTCGKNFYLPPSFRLTCSITILFEIYFYSIYKNMPFVGKLEPSNEGLPYIYYPLKVQQKGQKAPITNTTFDIRKFTVKSKRHICALHLATRDIIHTYTQASQPGIPAVWVTDPRPYNLLPAIDKHHEPVATDKGDEHHVQGLF